MCSVPELILLSVCEHLRHNHCSSKQMLSLNYFWNLQQFGHKQHENKKRDKQLYFWLNISRNNVFSFFFYNCPKWKFQKFQRNGFLDIKLLKRHIFLCNYLKRSIFIFPISVIFHQEHMKSQYSIKSTYTILHPTDLLPH